MGQLCEPGGPLPPPTLCSIWKQGRRPASQGRSRHRRRPACSPASSPRLALPPGCLSPPPFPALRRSVFSACWPPSWSLGQYGDSPVQGSRSGQAVGLARPREAERAEWRALESPVSCLLDARPPLTLLCSRDVRSPRGLPGRHGIPLLCAHLHGGHGEMPHGPCQFRVCLASAGLLPGEDAGAEPLPLGGPREHS